MAVKTQHSDWFKTWFNSKHYHQLYAHRDFSEAEQFIRRLFAYLLPSSEHCQVLDLACGKGRHSRQVSELGYEVVGMDLSEESISFAKQFETAGLHFTCGDMRHFSYKHPFDLILNLFTSFGYFETPRENQEALNAIAQNLKPKGLLVLDFLNAHQTRKSLPQQEQITRSQIQFDIHKFEENGFVVKDIQFESAGDRHHYREFVQLIEAEEFERLLNHAGLSLKESFGDYLLNPFDPETSERFIIIAERNHD